MLTANMLAIDMQAVVSNATFGKMGAPEYGLKFVKPGAETAAGDSPIFICWWAKTQIRNCFPVCYRAFHPLR